MVKKQSKANNTADLSGQPAGQALEVVDQHGRPLLHMPREEALRQGLRCRVVLVALLDASARVFISQCNQAHQFFPGQWNISASGYVLAKEALQDAARRELASHFPQAETEPVFLKTLDQDHAGEEDAGPHQISLFKTRPLTFIPSFARNIIQNGIFADRDEAHALLREIPELVTPYLRLAIPHLW